MPDFSKGLAETLTLGFVCFGFLAAAGLLSATGCSGARQGGGVGLVALGRHDRCHTIGQPPGFRGKAFL